MKILFVFFFTILLLPQTLWSSERFQQLTINEGLAHSDANCLVQDSLGMIWIGTNAGLQSYDGYELQTFDYYPEGNRFFQSHNRIHSMARTGNRLWLGTGSGLTCFNLNTHRYTTYYWKDAADQALSTYQNLFLYASSEKHLWVKTREGLKVFRLKGNTLSPIKWTDPGLSARLNDILGVRFLENTVWAVADKQLFQLEISGNKVEVKHSYELEELIRENEVICDIYCRGKFLFIRTSKGCYRFPIAENKLLTTASGYVCFHDLDHRIPLNSRGRFVVTEEGTLWCAYQEGVFKVEYAFSEMPVLHEYLRNTRDEKRSAQKIKDFLIDRFDNLWIATNSWGVYYCTLSEPLFKNLSHDDFEPMGFTQNEVVSITSRDDGMVYLIVEYANLLSYDMRTEQLRHIDLPADLFQNLYLQCVRMSRNQRHLYIGTNRGTFIFDTSNQTTGKLQLDNPSDADKINTSIADLQEDNEGRLWIGTWGKGLFCVEHPLKTPVLSLRLGQNTYPALVSNSVTSLFLHEENIFICTINGLNRLSLTKDGKINRLSHYQVDPQLGNASLSSNYLAGMDYLNDSVYWLGTIGGGVNRIVLHSEQDNDYTATCYTRSDGLSSNDCEIVMTDNAGNVWIGSNGIDLLNRNKKQTFTYDYADGLQKNAFKINSSHKREEDGTFFMGGLYGLSYFRPEAFVQEEKKYSLAFTHLYINNRLVIPGEPDNGRIVLDEILERTSRLTLNYQQNNFTISFAALGYKLSDQLMYRYRLSDKEEWHVLRSRENRASFSHLPYGSYKLELQLSTDMGHSWQTPAKQLSIRILPPWWLSTGAKLSYVLLFLLLAGMALRQYTKEQKLKRENEIQKILIEQDEEKYQAKMRFFMNASHELKTPLTLVLLAVEKLIGKEKTNKELHTILYNIKRMLSLIAELVDIRKQDLGISSLNLSWVNLSELLQRFFADMNAWAENKHITMTCRTDEIALTMDGDQDKLGKMILNLISNAIKYTDEGGSIEIVCKRGSAQDITPYYSASYTEGELPADGSPLCIIKVKDTGVGISPESIRLIYERFFQVDGKTQSHLGSGIGLAIVKNVVLQHKGMIVVSSERNEGTEFIVALPMYKTCKQQEIDPQAEINLTDFIQEQYNEFDLSTADRSKSAEELDTSTDNPDLPTLLIVEDNRELQMILKEQLSASYNVHIAENGRVGLEICQTLFPDVIVSDVMMPEMDGMEMCRQIKNNLSLATIPLVMLTAKDSVESQIEGYESGADLYIAKPFSMKLLEVSLRRLIAQRELWLKKSGNEKVKENVEDSLLPQSEETESQEEAEEMTAEQRTMIERLKKIIEEHMDDPDLSPDFLAKELGVSRTKLYRNMKRIDGYSLADYLRNVRLEKAAELLRHSEMNIQEVMFEVGFINSSHFTKIFKLKYGVTPTDYKRGK